MSSPASCAWLRPDLAWSLDGTAPIGVVASRLSYAEHANIAVTDEDAVGEEEAEDILGQRLITLLQRTLFDG